MDPSITESISSFYEEIDDYINNLNYSKSVATARCIYENEESDSYIFENNFIRILLLKWQISEQYVQEKLLNEVNEILEMDITKEAYDESVSFDDKELEVLDQLVTELRDLIANLDVNIIVST